MGKKKNNSTHKCIHSSLIRIIFIGMEHFIFQMECVSRDSSNLARDFKNSTEIFFAITVIPATVKLVLKSIVVAVDSIHEY